MLKTHSAPCASLVSTEIYLLTTCSYCYPCPSVGPPIPAWPNRLAERLEFTTPACTTTEIKEIFHLSRLLDGENPKLGQVTNKHLYRKSLGLHTLAASSSQQCTFFQKKKRSCWVQLLLVSVLSVLLLVQLRALTGVCLLTLQNAQAGHFHRQALAGPRNRLTIPPAQHSL